MDANTGIYRLVRYAYATLSGQDAMRTVAVVENRYGITIDAEDVRRLVYLHDWDGWAVRQLASTGVDVIRLMDVRAALAALPTIDYLQSTVMDETRTTNERLQGSRILMQFLAERGKHPSLNLNVNVQQDNRSQTAVVPAPGFHGLSELELAQLAGIVDVDGSTDKT